MKASGVDFDDMQTGFQSPRAAGIADWLFRKEEAEFGKLVNRLRVKKWAKANPDKRRKIANRYAAKPDVRARQDARARQERLAEHRSKVVVCQECGVELCEVKPRKGMPRRWCTNACFQRNKYQRTTPGARRCARRKGQP